jgi:integrase
MRKILIVSSSSSLTRLRHLLHSVYYPTSSQASMGKTSMGTVRQIKALSTVKQQVGASRAANDAKRGRFHLKPEEVEAMIKAARGLRHGVRDAAFISLAWHHGLRVSEACALRWDQIDRKRAQIEVRRLKGSISSTQPLQASELRLLSELHKLTGDGAFLFLTERGTPMTARAVQHLVAEAGRLAGIAFPVNPHMLRHSAGYKLANDGATTRDIQSWLGHVNLNNVSRYSALSAERLKRVWKE